MLGTQTIYYMKTRNLLFAAFLFAFGAASCENVVETPVTPDEEAKTYTIKLRAVGEVDVTYNPLTRFTPDDRDLYGVQVWHKPATTGSYERYAYGLFDSLEDVELEVTENYKYSVDVLLIDDGKDKVYCDSILVDQNYYLGYDEPFRGRNKYNGSSSYSITKLTNEFTYDSDRYFSSTTDYVNGLKQLFKAKDGKKYVYPEDVDVYYGDISNYIPTEDGATLSVYLKRMVFGLKVNIGDYFDNGEITLSTLDHNYTFTPENRVLEKSYSNMDAMRNDQWYSKDDLSKTYKEFSLDFYWRKADGTTVDWKPFNASFYRLKQTVVNLEYYDEDNVLGGNSFDIHYEDTEIENDYSYYNFGSNQEDYNW